MRAIATSILCLIGVAALASAADFPVLDGDRQATIVYNPEAGGSEAQAYKELAEYLKKSTGQEFATVAEGDFSLATDKFPLYVGSCQITQQVLGEELANIDRDGFMIVVEPHRVFLAGARNWSTYWAVCQFLEDYVGVRWLLPGPLGEDIPHQERIVISPVQRTEEPVILSRHWAGETYAPGGGTWSLRMRVKRRYQGASHNLHKVFDPDRFYDKHPEYFALRGGQRSRYPRGSGMIWPCMTSMEAAEAAAEVAREFWAGHPDIESYSFAPADGKAFCECPNCQAKVRPDKKWGGYPSMYSDLYFPWLNQIAKDLETTHPDKLIGGLAYSVYVAPPDDIELDRSILPYITFTIADTYEPQMRRAARELIEAWGSRVDQIAQYDYAYGMGNVFPRIYTHLIQETVQHAVQHNLKGIVAEIYPNWGLDAPRLYLTARIWWNPDVNVDALFDDWNERMFREAAEPMKKYFRRCEQAWTQPRQQGWLTDFAIFMRTPWLEVYTPEIIEELTGYLDEAAKLAQSDLVKERLGFFRKTWDLGVVFAQAHWASAGEELTELMAQDAPLEQVAAVLREMPRIAKRADLEKEVRDRVGDDRIAFFPILSRFPRWLPVPGRDIAKVYQWCVDRITPAVIDEAARIQLFHTSAIRRAVNRRITKTFGEDGPEHYQERVEAIRRMATRVLSAPQWSVPGKLTSFTDEAERLVQTRLAQEKHGINIDGILRDLAGGPRKWRHFKDFSVRGTCQPAQYRTEAKAVYDQENLYLAVWCYQDTSKLVVKAKPEERDGGAWQDDCVEIFIRSGRHPQTWGQIVINPAGALFDQWHDGKDEGYTGSIAHNFDCEWQCGRTEDHWRFELRVPLAELLISPAPGEVLRVNIVRNVVGGEGEVSTWYPQPTGGAHAALYNQGWVILE